MRPENKRYVNATHAFAYLGISKAFFYKLIRNDPSFPRGLKLTENKSVYDLNALDKWLYERNGKTEGV